MHRFGKYRNFSGNITINLDLRYVLTSEGEDYSAFFKIYRGEGRGLLNSEPGRFKILRKGRNLSKIFDSIIQRGPHLEKISDIEKTSTIDCLEELKKNVWKDINEN